jgi:plasmid stabilization system protein ParE
MSLPLVFRAEARAELEEAYHWYEDQQAGLGEEFLNAIREVLELIQEHPKLYEQVHRDIRRGLPRRFPYGVYYRLTPGRIEVLAGRREPAGWRERI